MIIYNKEIVRKLLHYEKLKNYFTIKIKYNEKQYWKVIALLVKQHKFQFV